MSTEQPVAAAAPSQIEEEGQPLSDEPTYRSILRATSIVGGGSLITILVGLARAKGVALLIGPAGLGIIGLLTSVMTTATTVLGLGLASSSVRSVAAAVGDPAALGAIRRALWRSNVLLGLVGLAALSLLSVPIARYVFGSGARAADVAWVSVGVLAALVAGAQMALLQGLRRTGDLARASVTGAVVAAAAGLTLLAIFRSDGIRWFVISTPVATMGAAFWFTRSLRPVRGAAAPPGAAVWSQWRAMISLGWVLMVAGVAGGVVDLFVRSVLARHLGVDAAGQYQAASAISIQYLGLILGAMAADYYPRLAQVADRPEAFRAAVNEQLEVAVLLAGPLLLAVLGLAPWVLTALYSSDFRAGDDLLRGLVVADVLKMATWTIGFALLARGRSAAFLALELTGQAVFAGATHLLVPRVGLVGVGAAFCLYLVWSVAIGWGGVRPWHGVSMHRRPAFYLAALLGAAILTAGASQVSDGASAAVGLALSALAASFAIHRFREMDAMPSVAGRLSRLLSMVRRPPRPE
ncbi:O-antigen translocase [Rubrivirga sp. S365]|uniref:O-antigen translocase n=1 Tax=Rubrivirga litoralis TaxID=3075598 RepID=A0ABU3BRA1_9BACT|nr:MULTISPECIES: O-antigen translocase [unclassified Rubrivirga]MDT0631814.1 O-antigen translocase [Rubrivirga sp. F394]MDT7856494.1 O-antigen translocase [Rubrivirga sp. S365]